MFVNSELMSETSLAWCPKAVDCVCEEDATIERPHDYSKDDRDRSRSGSRGHKTKVRRRNIPHSCR